MFSVRPWETRKWDKEAHAVLVKERKEIEKRRTRDIARKNEIDRALRDLRMVRPTSGGTHERKVDLVKSIAERTGYIKPTASWKSLPEEKKNAMYGMVHKVRTDFVERIARALGIGD